MAQRWSRQAAVHHHDDLTAAPRVVDRHDSEPLPRDGPAQAFWHGPAAHRAFAAAASLFVVAGIGLLGFFAASDLLGVGEPAGPSASGAAAQPGPGPSDLPGGALPDLDGILANATSSSSGPAPSQSGAQAP